MTACYVVVVALSGLRRSELAEMRRGRVHPEQLADGRVRYRIEARMIKGRSFGGEVQRWTVIEEVAQAFALVERLVEDDLPFARIQPSVRYPTLIRWINGEGARSFLTPVPTEWRYRRPPVSTDAGPSPWLSAPRSARRQSPSQARLGRHLRGLLRKARLVGCGVPGRGGAAAGPGPHGDHHGASTASGSPALLSPGQAEPSSPHCSPAFARSSPVRT